MHRPSYRLRGISTQREEEGKKEEIQVTTEVNKVFENEREAEVAEANAELAVKKAKWAQNSQVAEVGVLALRETKVQDANWELDKKQKAAEATLDTEEKVAEAIKAMTEAQEAIAEAQEAIAEALEAIAEALEAIAEATSYNRQRISDGEFYPNKKEADGYVAFFKALVADTRTLSDALGVDYDAL